MFPIVHLDQLVGGNSCLGKSIILIRMILLKTLNLFVLILSLTACSPNNSDNELKISLEQIALKAKADVGISIIRSGSTTPLEINGDRAYPLLSTFKFPIALTVLKKVQKGELSLSQEVFVKKEELLENTWSPFKNKYPKEGISISLEEALTWMIVHSDNNITDILLRLIGGTDEVEKFLNSKDFTIKNNEEDMHVDWDSQFINQASPNAFSKLLKRFSEGKILNKKNTEWLFQSMAKSSTGTNRIKGKLESVKIAHRPGTSFTNDQGITGAVNSVGIIELPNKSRIYISIFVRNTPVEFTKAEEVIADLAKASYNYYIKE